MARTKNKLPRWAEILLGTLIVGGLIWAVVPKEILYLSIGIVVVIIGGVSYIILRSQGIQPFKHLLVRFFSWLREESRAPAREFARRLSSGDFAKLRSAVGNRCENRSCRSRTVPTLVPHHIIDRHKEGSSNRLRNLLVVCENCHRELGRGVPNQDIQLEWVREPNRFSYDLKGQWKYER